MLLPSHPLGLLLLNSSIRFFVSVLGEFGFRERFAVLGNLGGDFFAVEEKESEFLALDFGDFAGGVEFGFLGGTTAGIIFADFVDGFLIGFDFGEEFFQVGELDLRFPGEIEDAFGDGLVYGDAVYGNFVGFFAAMEFEFVSNLNAGFGAIAS